MDTPDRKDSKRQWEDRTLQPHLKRHPDRDEDYSTVSSLPIERLYSPGDLQGTDFDRDIAWPGEYPLHAGRPAHHVPRQALDHAHVRRHGHGGGHQRALQVPPPPRTDGAEHGLRPAHPHGQRQRQPPRGRRGGQGGRGGRDPARHGDPFRRHPAGRGLHLHDDQRARGRGLRHVPRRGGEAGRSLQEAARHHPERHLQGVHRAEGVDLPSRALGPPDRGHHGVLGQGSAAVEHHLHQRLPHPRGGEHGGPGAGFHARRRHRLRPGGHGPRHGRGFASPRA